MTGDKSGNSRKQGHDLDDLEPLEEHSGERQEPEDDYYIRNYVLKESTGAGEEFGSGGESAVGIETAGIEPDAFGETKVVLETDVVEETETGVEIPAESETPGPPAFVSRTFGPSTATEEPAVPPDTLEPPLDETAMTRAERLTNTLSDLLESSPDIEAAVLVSMDGLAMASALPDTMHEDRVAAMSAAILGLGERASAELGRGALNQVFVEGENGYVFLMSAGGKAVLTALAGRGVKIGLVFYDMKDAAAKIAEAL